MHGPIESFGTLLIRYADLSAANDGWDKMNSSGVIDRLLGPDSALASVRIERLRMLQVKEIISNPQLFVKNLLIKFKNSTIIMITHRLSNVINADKILVFEKGDLSEQGDHALLLKNKSVYYSLLNNEEK